MGVDRVETDLHRPEQIFGEVAYYLVQGLELPPSIKKAAADGGIWDISVQEARDNLTENQLRLFAYIQYATNFAKGERYDLLLEQVNRQDDLLDGKEPGSGYRSFYRFFDLAVALEANKRGGQGLLALSLANARRGLAYDALFAVEHGGRIKTLPPGIRCGTEPMGLWCALEIICDGKPRGNPWPQWMYNNHRVALPAIALNELHKVVPDLYSKSEREAIVNWIIKRQWTDTFASLLAGVRTLYPVVVLIDKGRLWSSFTQSIAKADNIRFEVALSPGNVLALQVHRDSVDFYGDALVLDLGAAVRFTGRRHHKKEDRWEDVSEELETTTGGWSGADQEIRIDHRGIILNGKPIEGGAVPPPEPEPREPNWGVAQRQLRSTLRGIEDALEAIEARDAGIALQHLDLEDPTTFPGAMQRLRRALAALRGEI